MKSLLCTALMIVCAMSSHAQFLTISDVSSQGIDGVSMELGDPNVPGLHPGIGLFAPQLPADSIGSILFAPVQGQPPLRLSNLIGGGGGIGIEIVELSLESHSPGISLRLNDTLDDIFGGTQIFRLNDSLPRLRISNAGPAGRRGIDIEIVELDLVSSGPSIRLIQDTLLPSPERIEFIPNDSLPYIFFENRSTTSSSLSWGGLPPLIPQGPSITLEYNFLIPDSIPAILIEPVPGSGHLRVGNLGSSGCDGVSIDLGGGLPNGPQPAVRLTEPRLFADTTGLIELVPRAGRDHLTISNIGSSGCDGVSIDLGDPNLPTFFGPSFDLIRPMLPSAETIPVFEFRPLVTGPPLRLHNIGSSGLDGVVFETPQDLLLRSEDTIFNSSLRLNRLGTATIDANKGTLTVSNIGSSGDDGVSIDLGNTTKDSVFRFVYDANINVLRFVNPSRFIYETDLGLTTTYAYDGLDRRISKTYHDDDNPDNDLVTEYEYDTKRYDVRGPDTTNHTSSDSLETRMIYDGLDRVVREANKPGDSDTLRSVYTFDDNAYRFYNTDTVTFSNSGSLCYGRRFFEPGKSVSVDVLNKSNSARIRTVYDLNDRTVRTSGLTAWGYDSPGGLYCGSEYDNSSRLVTRVYADSTGSNNTMRCEYDPNAHSISCRSVSSYTYSTSNLSCRSGLTSSRYSRLYTDTSASRTMLCEYIPSIRTMSCSSFDSTSRTSSSNMRCSSVFDNSTARSFTRLISDQNTSKTMSVTYAPNARAMAIENCDARVYFSSASLGMSSRHIYVLGGYEELHVSGTDSLLLQFSPSTRSVQLIDPAGNPTSLSATGQISAGDLFTTGSVSANSGNIGGLLSAGQLSASGSLEVTGIANVFGDLTVTGAKNFRIDHPQDPENKYLYHSCIESPDMMNVYNGNIETDAEGFATVQLPGYFEALNIDFRYQLTVMGQFAQAIVKEKISDNQFIIQTDKPNVEVSWQVTGIRNDDYARENRVQPVVDKPLAERGSRMYVSQE